MSKLSLPALASAINELSAEVEALKRRPEPQPMPADLVRISDLPEPPDLLPLVAKIQELQREIAEVAEAIPSLDAIETRLDQIAHAQDVLRRDLSETRAWVGELGQSWQAFLAQTEQAESVGCDGLSARIEQLECRTCPTVDMGPVVARIDNIQQQINEITGGDA
jgi:hypothetical protein